MNNIFFHHFMNKPGIFSHKYLDKLFIFHFLLNKNGRPLTGQYYSNNDIEYYFILQCRVFWFCLGDEHPCGFFCRASTLVHHRMLYGMLEKITLINPTLFVACIWKKRQDLLFYLLFK